MSTGSYDTDYFEHNIGMWAIYFAHHLPSVKVANYNCKIIEILTTGMVKKSRHQDKLIVGPMLEIGLYSRASFYDSNG